jgi:cellulose synthase/poly-beta-1,6-N-acetylglucosamine synthase-like glycosyltransferase
MFEILFWACASLILFGYVGYPACMWLWATLRPRPARAADIQPTVSLIIAAYNEEKTIGDKLVNTLALTYPREKLDVVVVADGSDDRTADIVAGYADRGVRLLHRPERRGKTAALGRAVATSSADILLFSDANTIYSPDAVQRMARHFADPTVGGVSGRKIVLPDRERTASDGELAYWTYESALKSWESAVGSITTADGEIFAMRRELFAPPPDRIVHDDMYLTLSIIAGGHRVVYECDATSAEYASKTLKDEFHLKVRYASAGYQALAAFPGLFIPPRSLFAWQFLAHKFLRWIAPLLVIVLFASSIALTAPFYRLALAAQVAFYAAAAVGWIFRSSTLPLVYYPRYFCAMNTAFLYGLGRYLISGQTPLWRKAER